MRSAHQEVKNVKAFEWIDRLKEEHGVSIAREEQICGQTILEVSKENLHTVLSFFKERAKPAFDVLMDLTAVDFLSPVAGTKIVYWLHNPTELERIRITLFANRAEAVPSITSLWEGADWYEREIFDLFGVVFEGHPSLKRILMPDDWQGHPLRKDYALTEEPVQFKGEAKPKIPSRIIHVKTCSKCMIE